MNLSCVKQRAYLSEKEMQMHVNFCEQVSCVNRSAPFFTPPPYSLNREEVYLRSNDIFIIQKTVLANIQNLANFLPSKYW